MHNEKWRHRGSIMINMMYITTNNRDAFKSGKFDHNLV